jgi:23S rRNA (cytosine1962-C5)-methyltransferase
VKLKIQPTDFGHLGLFPEHASLWDLMPVAKGDRVLNLFAYSGAASIALALQGAQVCHLDASKGMVDWAKENAALNGVTNIRWIVDDVMKFLRREEKRGSSYEWILLDPPTFGRGGKGEVFKLEEEILPLLTLCKNVLSDRPKGVIFSCHTPGFTPTVLEHVLTQVFGQKAVGSEMFLPGPLPIPSGAFAKVSYDHKSS